MQLNMKEVDQDTLEVDGVDRRDYPDLCDSFFSFGLYADGTEMTAEELDEMRKRLEEAKVDNKMIARMKNCLVIVFVIFAWNF
jgi:hypothetical protein